jgi:hypothetical protein
MHSHQPYTLYSGTSLIRTALIQIGEIFRLVNCMGAISVLYIAHQIKYEKLFGLTRAYNSIQINEGPGF